MKGGNKGSMIFSLFPIFVLRSDFTEMYILSFLLVLLVTGSNCGCSKFQ